jgi:hypothetical protein
MDSVPATIQTKIIDSLPTTVKESIHKSMYPFTKGKQVEPNVKDPQHPHYENTCSSHSPWGYPHSWNKLPKVEMHKFDGYNPARSVSQMEQYLSLHNIWDDETKIHVWVLYLNQE